MHRLKEWFGIKDWQGPKQENGPPEVATQTDTSQTEKTESQDNLKTGSSAPIDTSVTGSSTVTTITVPNKIKSENESLYFKYNDKMEMWLRQYIPVKKDECAQCRLVTVTFIGSLVTLLVYKTYMEERKNPLPKNKRKFFLGMIASFSGFCGVSLYQLLFRKGIYQEKWEDESRNDFYNRVLQEDIERYKRYLNFVSNKLESMRDTATGRDKK